MSANDEEDSAHSSLFEGARVYVSKGLPDAQARKLVKILARGHAQLVDFGDSTLTHFVTQSVPSSDSVEYAAPRKGLHYVTPLWIERTIILGTRQEPDFFSPHPAMLFSGVVATACDLSKSDNEVMAAGVSSLGGQWRYALTRDVTHLFALGTGSLKYRTAMHFKDAAENEVPLPIKILVPHWFDDVVRLGARSLPTEPYEWPEPRVLSANATSVLKATGALSAATGEEDRESRRTRPLSSQKKALYDTIFQDSIDLPSHRPASDNTWAGLRIMFGSNLGFTARQRDAHVADVVRGGGEVVEYDSPEDELERLASADVYIAQYRSGSGFVKAYKLKKTIGNLHWFWYVRCTGMISPPTDQLLHYPIPKTPIEGFSRHLITVTNFTGKDREYIKKLLLVLGVPYTATMTGKNTAVIAALIDGEKTERAAMWGIPVVNHMWLEDCFAQWRDISPAQEKYISFPPGLNFGDVLADDGGRAGLGLAGGTGPAGRVGYDQAELDRMEREITQEAEALALAEKENKAGPEVTETPKRGILKKSKGTTEDAAATTRRLVAERTRRTNGGDVEMDEAVEASSNAFHDYSVPLDDDGRLSMTGSELGFEQDPRDDGEENQMEMGGSHPRQKNQSKPAPVTPSRSRPRASGSSSKLLASEAQARPGSKAKTKATPSDDEERHPPPPAKPKRAQAITKVKPPAVRHDSDDEQQSIEEAPRVGRPTSRRGAMKGKSQPKPSAKPTEVVGTFSQSTSARNGTVIKTYRSKSRSRSRSRPRPSQVEDEVELELELSASKPRRKTKPAAEEDSDIVPSRGRKASRKAPATPKTNAMRRHVEVPADTEEDGDDVVRKRTPAVELDEDGNPLTALPAPSRTPRRRASVLLPTLAQVRSASQQRLEAEPSQSVGGSNKKKKLVGEVSVVLQARDAPQKSPKRGRPSNTRSAKPSAPKSPSRSPSPPSPSVLIKHAAQRRLAAEAGPSRAVDPPVTHGRRSAAAKAAQRLHEEIMPDLVNFQKELKAGHVKSGHDEERISPRGKGKEKERARKRASLEGEDGEEDAREVKKQKTEAGPVAAKARGRKSDVPPPPPEDEDEVEVVEEPKKRGRPVGKAKGATQPSESQTDGKDVVIMTTQVTLSDDQTRALTKMGVKFTTKPLECTHLVARAIVRTEKFLVAMAVAPHIVTDKWVDACVSKKKIMPEKDYILKDPDNEKRYHYKLADALSRAHKKGRKLFEGKTFYVTPKVPVDAKLLKAVITAGGGQFSSQNPTVRILKGHSSRFVVSTPADVSIWRPLAEQGFPVYSQELVLTSVLRQEVDWDDKAYFVPGSL